MDTCINCPSCPTTVKHLGRGELECPACGFHMTTADIPVGEINRSLIGQTFTCYSWAIDLAYARNEQHSCRPMTDARIDPIELIAFDLLATDDAESIESDYHHVEYV